MGMTDKQFQSWVRFMLEALLEVNAEQDPEKPEARLEGAAPVGPDRVLPLWSLFRVVGKAKVLKELLEDGVHIEYPRSSSYTYIIFPV